MKIILSRHRTVPCVLGSAFVFSDKTKETPKGMHQGVLKKESLADTTNEVSNNKIPQKKDFVNTNISDETENYSEVEENGEGSFSLGSPVFMCVFVLSRRKTVTCLLEPSPVFSYLCTLDDTVT